MWDCKNCGCQAIAASLVVCPVCLTDRDLPASAAVGEAETSAGGTSLLVQVGDTGAVPENPQTSSEPEGKEEKVQAW